ncbi:DNA translocase FtsK [Pseudogracilibacillus sp. SE30717A]|uniref:DNA translocase FtsK n=1 Tax=Pseudogracilibacillus sp. SE30717A TaxID=3098293 RepID=UPI00300DD846
MWNRWKEKIIDFFFDEVEEEVVLEEEPAIKRQDNRGQDNTRSVNTKVTYQYPKEQVAPFRFPVIPDDGNKNIKSQKKQVTDNHFPKKQPRSRRNATSNRVITDPLIYGYKGQILKDELEEVPAYMRRKKTDYSKKNIEIEKPTVKVEIPKETIDPLAGTTRPEELDRIFRKKDGKEELSEKKNVVVSKSEKMNIPETLLEKKQDKVQADIFQTPSLKENVEESVIKQEESMPVEDQFSNHIQNSIFEKKREQVIQRPAQLTNEDNVSFDVDVPNHLLNDPLEPAYDDTIWLQEQQSLLEQTLTHFNIQAKIVNVTQGPSVTRFEIQPAMGVKVSRIRNLSDDIKLNMAAKDIRIEAPIPGKNTIGIEVPNQYPQVVTLQEIIETEEFETESSPLTIALGLTIEGKPLITNIGKMPHGLIAGATGSGKSVCINTILLSLLYKAKMDEVKFLLIDPKMVELTPYNGIPHLVAPVITDPQAATMALKWAVNEMEERYEKFVETGVRNIEKYNEKVAKLHSKDKMPYLVIVIDELADLMIVSPQEVEDAICRIAQKARACGIHLLLATQRPSVDVITGLIKANIPTRIAFSVSSQVDSRTIIDTNGAEKLLGRGDMLFIENGSNKRIRLQGPFVSDEEIDRVAHYLRSKGKPNYLFEQEQLLIEVEHEEEDDLLSEVISFVVTQNHASTSLLQRRFRIGYNRAARLIDTLQNKGIVSAQNGSKPREVLVTKSQVEELV